MVEKSYMTILAAKEFNDKEMTYRLVCPKKMGKADMSFCKGCGYWMASGFEHKEVVSPSGTRASESVPAVDCKYPLTMQKDELARFMGLYMGTTGQKPKEMPHDPDEFDAIVEECLSHIPAAPRKS
jgi:hypothetical protein